MTSHAVEPRLGLESFSCPHCNVVAHQEWFSLFLKAENNAADVIVLTPEAAMSLVEHLDDEEDRKRGEQFIERLKNNEAPTNIKSIRKILKSRWSIFISALAIVARNLRYG